MLFKTKEQDEKKKKTSVTGRPANAACVPALLLIECRR